MVDIPSLLKNHLHRRPVLGEGVYIAQGAVVLGDVRMGRQSSIWYNAIARGDINRVAVGEYTNIQDNAVLHVAEELPCEIGDWVTVGHTAIVHACVIGDECLIGMGATVLDGAVVGEQSIIGAGALVLGGTQIEPGSLVVGNPAKVKRSLTAAERQDLRTWAKKYVDNAAWCLERGIGVGRPIPAGEEPRSEKPDRPGFSPAN